MWPVAGFPRSVTAHLSGTTADPGPQGFHAPGLPSRWLYLTEPARGLLHWNAMPLALPWLLRAPRGDGHGVLVLPGLLATDTSTAPLRGFLRRLGYHPRGWDLGRNLGPTKDAIEGMRRAVHELVQSTGSAVSLVGWSLGGIYARELARGMPSLVRRVITLASPFRLTNPDDSYADRAYRTRTHLHAPHLPTRDEIARPIPVPSSALYSHHDGIVPWSACVGEPSDRHENIEVRCAHLGFGADPATVWAIADRLAQARGTHTPFRPPHRLGWLYPATA
jgi:hypothetical protein